MVSPRCTASAVITPWNRWARSSRTGATTWASSGQSASERLCSVGLEAERRFASVRRGGAAELPLVLLSHGGPVTFDRDASGRTGRAGWRPPRPAVAELSPDEAAAVAKALPSLRQLGARLAPAPGSAA